MKEIISISILSIFLYICFKLMLQSIQIDYKENLTMDKNLTKIIIENYCDETIVFTMPVDSTIEINKIYSNSFHEEFYIEELKITATGIIDEE